MRQWLEIFVFHLAIKFLAFVTRNHLPALVVTSGLIVEDGRVLLVRRRDGRGLNLPGGYLTFGEDPIDGALREIREETGYFAEVDRLFGVYGARTPGRGQGSILVLYLMRRIAGSPRSSHEGDPVWLTPAEAFRERLDSGTREVLRDYLGRSRAAAE